MEELTITMGFLAPIVMALMLRVVDHVEVGHLVEVEDAAAAHVGAPDRRVPVRARVGWRCP